MVARMMVVEMVELMEAMVRVNMVESEVMVVEGGGDGGGGRNGEMVEVVMPIGAGVMTVDNMMVVGGSSVKDGGVDSDGC
ncbi:hypothetical protein C1H46_007578 [Malus baccata]|uniref:Uncharacterized protein n=1 Tax=Malus baccata TaxID=106549 RepID=A0A540N6X2_MALBA|nr:hypothetical protein C1H46_007578 [Malus baccata]